MLSLPQFGLLFALYLVGGSLALAFVVELIVWCFKRRERR